ncbi:MAG: hypothetical protein K1Y02_24330, partial [Candidatus Hydrogenedentes bacterium]|nr:hypothetical protein [Candidatus Hydrogenedentota bacterium]
MPSKRKTLRWIELIAVLAVIVVATLLLFPYIKYNLLPTLPTTCVDNLKQWATIFSMYREENMYAMPPIQGFQPFGPAENAKGCLNVHDEYSFSPEWGAIYPDYAATPLVLVCPEGPYLSPPEKKGPIVTRPWRPNEQVFGVLESESFWSCEDEGAITNADASYTYLGWRIEPNNPYDILITPELAAKLNLPASGPA